MSRHGKGRRIVVCPGLYSTNSRLLPKFPFQMLGLEPGFPGEGFTIGAQQAVEVVDSENWGDGEWKYNSEFLSFGLESPPKDFYALPVRCGFLMKAVLDHKVEKSSNLVDVQL